MDLPDGFQFSQGSLQDYVDCHRRFQLRYLLNLAWPAVQSEPVQENESAMRQGEHFHRMVHQHLLGIPADRLGQFVQDEDLRRWWENYLAYGSPAALWGFAAQRLYPEMLLAAGLTGSRIVARYDLVVSGAGRLTIIDWKTARRRPRRQWLMDRLQTRLYPYMLVRSGAQFQNGLLVLPEQVEMIYWFTNFPDQPERISYSREKYQADETYLNNLVGEIQRFASANVFNAAQLDMQALAAMTPQDAHCAYCVYRSLCERGVKAGALDEMEDIEAAVSIDAALDFEQIAEIEF